MSRNDAVFSAVTSSPGTTGLVFLGIAFFVAVVLALSAAFGGRDSRNTPLPRKKKEDGWHGHHT